MALPAGGLLGPGGRGAAGNQGLRPAAEQTGQDRTLGCKSCERDEGWFGEVGLGAGYANDDGATRFRNWVPSQQDSGMLGIFNADLQYREKAPATAAWR